MPALPSILVCAGELSGDRLAAPVVVELARRLPGLRCFGAGGEALAAAGVEVRHPIQRLAVTGASEALRRAGGVIGAALDLARETWRRRPALAILVDYPGLNLRLAAVCRRLGVPVLWLVAPQRWAWLGWRLAPLRRLDRLAVILPFEEAWFRARGVAARYVGHPLLDRPPLPDGADVRRRLGLGEARLLALLPGSRPNELRRHLPLFQSAARQLGGLRPILGTSPAAGSALAARLAPELGQANVEELLAVAEVALCASGTVTLEAALAGVPAVICYRLSPLSEALARRLVAIDHIGLPNLIAGARIVPELVGREATADAIASAARRVLEERGRILEGYGRVRAALGAPGFAARSCELALELLGGARGAS